MGESVPQSGEWIDGFLFVGNQLSLDLLNTSLVTGDGPLELLPDTASLERWLIASGVIRSSEQKHAVSEWRHAGSVQPFLEELLAFREGLRAGVLQFESGIRLNFNFLRELNQKLLAYPYRHVLVSSNVSTELQTYLDVSTPTDLWRVFADSAAHLFADIPASRVRKCEGCVVNFYDVSKNGSRRWCSMHMCGGREKVATYRQKKRALLT